MRPIIFAAVLALLCCTAPGLAQVPDAPPAQVTPAAQATSVQDMMASTVLIKVAIDVTQFIEDEPEDGTEKTFSSAREVRERTGWSGSGVVYDKRVGAWGPQSLILSAHHVLETPVVGSIEQTGVDFLGIYIPTGTQRIDAVTVTIVTNDGRVCFLTPLAMGVTDTRDVATGVADCDAGRVASIAVQEPFPGERVVVTGYPEGFDKVIVTEGYMSGVSESGYQATSAPAYGGNSGGPAWVNGEVVGLLVRASRSYPHITLLVPLSEVWRRMGETPPL